MLERFFSSRQKPVRSSGLPKSGSRLQVEALEDRYLMDTGLGALAMQATAVHEATRAVVLSQPARLAAPSSIPGTVTLYGPGGTTSASPTFTWSSASGASYYRLYVANSATGQVVFDQWLQTTSYTLANKLSAGQYRFWVQTWGNNEYGAWTAPKDFSVQATKPGTPVLYGPSGTNVSVTPTFTWSAASGATWYRLYVKNETSNYIAIDKWVSSTSYTHDSSLTPGHRYTYWVLGWRDGQVGDWSSPSSFTVAAVNRQAPSLINPVGTVASQRPLFTWTAVPRDYYQVIVYHVDSGNVSVSQTTFDTQYRPSSDLPKGKYTWSVKAWYDQGQKAIQSGEGSFTII